MTHEVDLHHRDQESGGSLRNWLGDCPKLDQNPRHHDQLIPVDEFCEQSLHLTPPLEPHRQQLFNFAQSCLPLVVRLETHDISEARPARYYLFSDRRGQQYKTVASGWVSSVRRVHDSSDDVWFKVHLEKCDVCRSKFKPEQVNYVIRVNSVRHAVYDQTEADSTKVVFFDHNDDGSGSVTEGKCCCRFSDTDSDVCIMYLLTQNEALVDRLNAAIARRRETRSQLVGRWRLCQGVSGSLDCPVVVIGHPHGRKLHISCGYKRGRVDTQWTLRYDVTTCVGSSGGLVIDVIGDRRYGQITLEGSSHRGHQVGVGVSSNSILSIE